MLLCDWLLTNQAVPQSYLATGIVNDDSVLRLDLRVYGQKFAFYYRELDKPLIQYARMWYKPGVFVDVGASIGLWSVGIGHQAKRQGGRVIAIEPVPHHRARLEENLRLNGLEKCVDVIQVAVGEGPGRASMALNPIGVADNASISPAGDLEVEVTSLDQLLQDRKVTGTTFIKVDAEGYDPLVIAGASRTIERERPLLFVEFLRERMEMNGLSIEWSWELLVGRLGYRCGYVSETGFVFIDEPGKVENVFFLPPGHKI